MSIICCFAFRMLTERQKQNDQSLTPVSTSRLIRKEETEDRELRQEFNRRVEHQVDIGSNPPSLHEVKELLPADARALKLTIQPWEIRAVDDFEKVFAALNKQRPDGLYLFGADGVMRPNQKRIVGFALKSRLPSVYSNREAVEAGGLMSYGADLADSYRRVAYFVDRILKGAKPADLPVEQPTKFELVINLKTAKQIGLTIPQSCCIGRIR